MKSTLKNLSVYILLILFGATFTLCFAPYRWFLIGFISFPPLYYLIINAKSGKQAFWRAFFFGMGHHVTGLYWVANSLMVEPDKFAWLVPFAILLLPAYCSIYIGVTAWLTYRSKLTFYSRVVYFAGIWTFAEIARTFIFTGFPWNLAGMVFITRAEFASFASIIGVYGLSFFAILFYTTPFIFYENLNNIRKGEIMRAGLAMKYFLPILVFSMASGLFGLSRMNPDFTDVKLRIVQPSIPQSDKFNPEKLYDNEQRYYMLTQQRSETEGFIPDVIIWPEAATPYNFETDNWLAPALTSMIPDNSALILGSLRYELEGDKVKNAYNSLRAVTSNQGLDADFYDKSHLVPFGEYIPLRSIFPNVDKITHGMGDFAHGKGNVSFRIGNLPPFLPLICYEVIFSPRVAGKDFAGLSPRPEWILNVTNDGWFGNSSGPQQHLDIARMRAIESGLPVIRAANNGISAVIDSYGRVVKQLALNDVGVIDAHLPLPAAKKTPYSKHGLKIPLIAIFSILCFVMIRDKKLRLVNKS